MYTEIFVPKKARSKGSGNSFLSKIGNNTRVESAVSVHKIRFGTPSAATNLYSCSGHLKTKLDSVVLKK